MQIYSYLIWLLFIFSFVLIDTRNINNRFDDDYNINEQRKQLNRHLYRSSLFPKKLFNFITNEEYFPNEQDRLSTIARRIKAIIKGDPREFMG